MNGLQNNFFSILKKYDISFFFLTTVIFIFGIFNLYSATHANPDSSTADLYKVQLVWFLLALVAGVLVSFINPKTLYRYSYVLYVLNIILLIAVLLIGQKSLGAQRWLQIGPIRFQPSEIMKVASVLALARWFSKTENDMELGLKELMIPFLIAFVPALMIIVQPDLGTGLLVLLIFFLMTFYCRLKMKTLMILCILALVSGSVMYKFGLKDYQRKRILTFIDPTADARGSGYNAIQSEIAIGSGQLFGKGYKKSSQASLHYLPENHTDFVFSVFNEEHGFVYATILIALYVALFLRFVWLSSSALKMYDSIVVIGIMGIFFWHTLINMCMVTGLLPIVGLPLPLMSYGGSSLLTFGICCGITTAISNSRNIF